MALHVQIPPETQARLAIQKRNATITSITIAILLCVLLVAILFYIALSPLFKNSEELITYTEGKIPIENINKPEVTNEVQKKPSSPTASMAKVIASSTPSPIAVPVALDKVTEPSLDFGDGADFGSGWGSGNASGAGEGGSKGGFGLPSSLQKRCTAKDRIDRLIKGGGKEEYEYQVIEALRWLQDNQSPDGSWTAQRKPVAMTGLALLAYLGHCETPASDEFGETVQNAILYLVSVGQRNNGQLGSTITSKDWCYEHAIATYALAEAYTLCNEFEISIPKLEETVIMAGNQIIANQHTKSGGWDYYYDTTGSRGGDTSIVCWHLQALKACKTSGLEIDNLESSARKGIAYLEGAKNGKGTVGYKTNGGNNKHGPTMTPGAALCLQQWDKGRQSFARNAVDWSVENKAFDYNHEANLYMHYYSSQAVINAGGDQWKEYNETAMKNLAESQNGDGSWSVPPASDHQMSSPHYATCLATLMMEVYYRFLPSSAE